MRKLLEKNILFIILIFSITTKSLAATSSDPDCRDKDAWPAAMAFTFLKNANLVTNETLDFSKTKVSRLASEKISKDLYRQIHLVTYVKKDGNEISAVTVNDASSEECSMSGVDVYVIDKKLGDYKD